MKRVIIIFLSILVIDQIIKIWVKTTLNLHEAPDALDLGFFRIYFVENPGMAFGWAFGGPIGKILLTTFRLFAVGAIGYYTWKQAQKPNVHKGFLTALALIAAGAMGNILDSAFYGYIFDRGITWDPSLETWSRFYDLPGVAQANFEGYAGFFQGAVVDMFQFTMTWPEWMPWVGGKDVFGAIFNFADAAISIGVILIILRNKTFFKSTSSVDKSKTVALENPIQTQEK